MANQEKLERAVVRKYSEKSVLGRIEAFFLDNIEKVATREQIQEVARDPDTKKIPENWHQRLSDLRCLHGYTIKSWRDDKALNVSEYLMTADKRKTTAKGRVRPSAAAWKSVLDRAKGTCEWNESGEVCGLREGEIDPIGGGTVHLQADHKTPHSVNANTDPNDPNAWQALCGRHQVVKKNFWDNNTGKLNVYAIVQAAGNDVKREVFDFLKSYFGE